MHSTPAPLTQRPSCYCSHGSNHCRSYLAKQYPSVMCFGTTIATSFTTAIPKRTSRRQVTIVWILVALLILYSCRAQITRYSGVSLPANITATSQLVECEATFAVLMSRFSLGLSVLRLRQWMYRRMRRAWVAWSGWSVPASVKYLNARNCASILLSQEA